MENSTKWKTKDILQVSFKTLKVSLMIMPMNTVNKKKLVLQKNRFLLNNMHENYKNCNEEQQMTLEYEIQIWN